MKKNYLIKMLLFSLFVFGVQVTNAQDGYSTKTTQMLENLKQEAVTNQNYSTAAAISAELKSRAAKKEELKSQMNVAIQKEDYSKAAELKQQITAIDEGKGGGSGAKDQQRQALQKDLDQALKAENYERAAEIKQQLKELDGGASSTSKTTSQSSSNSYSSVSNTKSTSSSYSSPKSSDKSFSAFGGLMAPMGDYADGTSFGVTVGGEMLFPLEKEGLSAFADFQIVFNMTSSDSKDAIESELDKQVKDKDITNYAVGHSNFINVPVVGGLKYDFNEKYYGKVGLGLNFLKITDSFVDTQNEYFISKEETSYDLSTSLAFKMGVGMVLNSRWNFELFYNNGGKGQFSGESTNSIDYKDEDMEDDSEVVSFDFKSTSSLSYFTLMAVYKF